MKEKEGHLWSRSEGHGFIDVHSHILPKIDDGSSSAEESLRMLSESRHQGVDVMIATPHFYAAQNPPAVFLQRRAAAYEQLMNALEQASATTAWPQIRCGAEVAYFTGMSNCEELPLLCIEGTNILLLEMPFCRWSSAVLQEVLVAKERFRLRFIIAHIERYIDDQPSGTLEEMLDTGLFIQANAGCFLHWSSRGKALRRLRKKQIHLLGSDCHNMVSRPPDLGQATAVIEAKCGRDAVNTLRENAWELLNQPKAKQ